MKKANLMSLVSMIMIAASSIAQNEFSQEIFISQKGDSLHYRELQPQTVIAGKKYPLVLFLHGAGERGNDNISQLRHGANMFVNPVNRNKYPTFALFPQCPSYSFWAPINRSGIKDENFFPYDVPITPTLQSVKELLDFYIENYPVDRNKIYIIGLSMGGMGTFDMMCRFPNLFTAAIPICGGINTKRLEQIEITTSIRIYHGDADPVVPVAFSRNAYTILKAKGVDVEYIEFPGIEHNSWTPAFNMPNFMEWLFSQNK
ncbi:MAG: dienelactone hydrolase family protein [Dysgonamonadaceae bacterium]|nr:dienelactone hydrolase family protein [Dysgonamonadaceae bacterium]